MKKHLKLFLFIALTLLQLAIPAQMILNVENILDKGEVFKFVIKPIDPVDNFRGNYLQLHLDNNIPVDSNTDFLNKQTVYVSVENGSDGYAKFKGISSSVPEKGNYFKTNIQYVQYDYEPRSNTGDTGTTKPIPKSVVVNIPFDRYYMAENKAKLAEKTYNSKLSNNNDVYVTVRILKGKTALEKLYIDGETIEDYLKKH